MRTQRRRVIAPVAIAGASALAIAGCAGPASEVPDEIEGLDLSGSTIEIASDWSGAEQASFQAVLDVFEDATGATVNYTSLGNNIATVIGTQLAGGSPPDIALLPQPGLLQQLAEDGHLTPLTGDVLDAVEANFAQDWIDLGSADGDVYGVWFKGSHKSTVWYNADVYDEAGAVEPETWEEFLAQLQLVADAGYEGISIGADVGWPLTDWFENVYLRTAGPELYDQLSNHEIPWTDESVTVALEYLAELWGDSQIVQSGGGARTFADTIPEVFGDNPAAGTVYEGDFVASNITNNTNSVVGENALFYEFPSIDGSPSSVVGGGNVAVAFNDDEATLALLQYLASAEAAEVWVPRGGFTSPNQNVDLALYPDEVSLQIAESLVGAEVFRFDMSDLAPSAFGGTEGGGQWQIMISFYNDPSNIEGTQEALEEAALQAWGQ